jgi:glycosyltransferase involved in cell wall biosynthesis
MNKISLVLATYHANISMLHQALECSDLFDEVILHVNDKETMSKLIVPKQCKVIYVEERCSVQTALNDAISLAYGNYILPWTDDDFFHKENLAEVINYVRDNPKDDIIYYPIFTGNEKEWTIWVEPNVTLEKLKEKNLIPFSSIYKKEVWKKVSGYKLVSYSDWGFWLEVMKAGYKFKFINTPIYYHRHGHKQTLSKIEAKTFNKEEFLRKLNIND